MTIHTTSHGTATPERNDEMTKAPKQIWLNKQGTAVVPAGVSIWENVDVLYIRADQVDAREAQASAEGFDRGVKEAQPIVESLRAELHSLYDAIGFDPLDLENGHDNARAAIDALLKAEREKALREAADMLASDAAYWGDEAENASTRHLTEMYSGKAVACQECKDVIEALISEVATKEPSSNP